MTPKEKAIKLVTDIQVEHNKEERYYTFHMSLESAKRAALIAVDEIIPLIGRYTDYWIEVKQEIEKI